MHRIGILKIDWKEVETINTLFKSNGYMLVDLKNDKQPIECLVILSEKKENFSEVCKQLMIAQEKYSTFIWLYAPQCGVEEKNIYLQLGANGVVNEPYHTNELVLMIKNMFAKLDKVSQTKMQMNELSKVILNDSNLSVSFDGKKEILLTRLEYKVMAILYEQANTAVSYESLYQSVWQERYEDTLKYRIANLVFNLREKLGNTGLNPIKTVRSKGYMLNV